MAKDSAAPRTALAAPVAAEGNHNISFAQLERMAASAAKSGLFGVKNADEAMSLMLLSQAEGIHPMLAVRDYHIIKGRPALKADTLLARFQSAGGKVEWQKYTDTEVVGIFSHPQSPTPVQIDWNMTRAKNAGLADKDNWKTYPRAMLRARCISEGVRTCFPGVAVGTYSVEEAQDMEIDVTPARLDAQIESAAHLDSHLTEAERMEHFDAMENAKTTDALQAAFGAAWSHAKAAHDPNCQETFRQTYERRKGEIEAVALAGMKT